jgi:hypothetical protein
MSNIPLPSTLSNAKVDTYTRTDGSDTVHVQAMVTVNPVSATSGTLTAAAQSVTATSLGDMDGVMVRTGGTFSGTLAFEASTDGTNWYALFMCRGSSLSGESTRALTGTTLESWRANLAGFSQFRVRCSAYTSGTANITITPVSMSFEPTAVAGQILAATQSGTWTVQPGNTANTTPWLVTSRSNIFYNDSVTAQAASATLTGTTRDVGIAAGAVCPFAAFNATAFADQAGTLRIEMSTDNVTWRRATADTAVAANAVVTLSVPVVTRYYRVVYVNGATLQTAFMLNSSFTAA